MIYLMNDSVIPSGCNGIWSVTTQHISNVKAFLGRNDTVSAVGHESTAALMSRMLNRTVEVNRISVKPEPGDILVCFKLKNRAPEGVILTEEQLEELGHEWTIMTYYRTTGGLIDAALGAAGVNQYIATRF